MATFTNRRTFLAASSGLLTGARLLGAEHALVPYLLGANTAIAGYGLPRAINLLRTIGFRTVELQNLVGVPEPTSGQFPGFRFDEASDELKARIRASLEGFDHITTHLPYTGLEYFAPGGEAARTGMRTLEMALEATAFLGAKVAAIHPKPGPGMNLKETWPFMIQRFRRWGDLAKAGGFQLALETGYPASVADFVRLVTEVDHEHVGATLDVGHQARYEELAQRVKPEERATPAGIRAYNDINMELVERLGSKLIHLHIHDIQPETWKEHKPLVHGFIDYPRLIRGLREIRYRGVLVFEIGGPPSEMPNYLIDAKRKLERYLRQS